MVRPVRNVNHLAREEADNFCGVIAQSLFPGLCRFSSPRSVRCELGQANEAVHALFLTSKNAQPCAHPKRSEFRWAPIMIGVVHLKHVNETLPSASKLYARATSNPLTPSKARLTR